MINKIGFVILHYYVIEETKKCIESIEKKIDCSNYEIIVVDNASPNNTGEELKEFYKDDKKVHIIMNDKNLGFANGNNVGFKYAKYSLNCEYIVMLNNDTCLISDNWCEEIEKEYKNSRFCCIRT